MAGNMIKAAPVLEQELVLDISKHAKGMQKATEIVDKETKRQEKIIQESSDRVMKIKNKEHDKAVNGVSKQAEKQNRILKEQIRKSSIDLDKVGSKMQSFGVKSSVAITTPILLGVRKAVNTATEYESAFAGVRKTVDASEQEFKELSEAIREMSKQIPKSASEIAHVAEIAGQLGIKKEALLDFVKVMIDLGEATNLSSEEGASALAKFANVAKTSDKDFGRLGSTIVHLGNNLATTERDIVALSTRIVGAGEQVGLTEPQILGLAGSLSSVGIEAEMGGSAISKLLINMNLANSTGTRANQIFSKTGLSLRELQLMQSHSGKAWKALAEKMGYTKEELDNFLEASTNLQHFSEVSGLTAKQFKEAYGKDAIGVLQKFLSGLDGMKAKGKDATLVLDEMGIKEVRLRDTILRSASAHEKFKEAQTLASTAWRDNIALTKEANQRYATNESKMKMMKNRMNDVSISLGEKLLPHVTKLMEKGVKILEWFDRLDPSIQNGIINFGLFSAALGPASSAVGTFLKIGSGIGKIGKWFGKLKAGSVIAEGALSSVGSTAVSSAGGFSVLASKIGGAISAVGPWGLAAAGVVGAGALIHHEMSKKVVPAIDLYKERTVTVLNETSQEWNTYVQRISDKTKEVSKKMFDMSSDVKKTTEELYVGLSEKTDEGLKALNTKVETFVSEILVKNEQNKNDTIAKMTEMFKGVEGLSAESKAILIKDATEEATERATQIENMKKRILELNKQIAEGSIEQQKKAKEELNKIYNEMETKIVDVVSDSKVEQELLLYNLKNNKKSITTEMLSEIVKKYKENYDAATKKINEAANEQIRIALRVKEKNKGAHDETSKAAIKAADEIIKKAEEQREKQLKATTDIREEGLKKLKEEYGDLTKNVDANTGKILNGWEKLAGDLKLAKSSWDNLRFEEKTRTITTHYKQVGSPPKDLQNYNYMPYRPYATGHFGGLKRVPYDNYYARLHKDERVLTAKEAKDYELKNNNRGLTVNIASFVNNTKEDIEQLSKRLQQEIRRQQLGIGGY